MTTNVYMVAIKIMATAYIKASSEEEAFAVAEERFGEGEETEKLRNLISSAPLSSPHLPDVSISPAVTFCGLVGDMDVQEEDAPLYCGTRDPFEK